MTQADWHVELDTAATLAALRRAGMYDALWWRSFAGRQVAAAGRAHDETQRAVWQRIADAAGARVAQLTQVTMVDESEVRA